jgi:hypothetical protein
MAMSMKMAVFWDVAPCSLVGLSYVSEELTASIIRVMRVMRVMIITLMMKAVSSSEMPLNIYQTMWHNIPEDSHPQMSLSLLICGGLLW